MNARISRFVTLSFLGAALTVVQLVMLGGCAANRLAVEPHPGRNVVVLSAEDVVEVMRRAWFSDEQIKEVGPKLRDALAFHGAARIRSDERTEALFLVDGDLVYVVVRGRGGFFYNVSKEPSPGLTDIPTLGGLFRHMEHR